MKFNFIIFLLCAVMIFSSCITTYKPNTKIPTVYTGKNDFRLSGEVGFDYHGANLSITPINNLYIHGGFASFRGDGYDNNQINAYGLGAYKLFDVNHHLELQLSVGNTKFHYYKSESSFSPYYAGRSDIYSGFISYTLINEKCTHSFVFNSGYIKTKYSSTTRYSGLRGTTQKSGEVAWHYIVKLKLINNLKLFMSPGYKYLTSGMEKIDYNPLSFRFGLELSLR